MLPEDKGWWCAGGWGGHDLPPQAGIGVWERGPDGLLAAIRVYDDVEAPV